MSEASKDTGANRSKIRRCCNKKEKGTNGMHFCYANERNSYCCEQAQKRGPLFTSKEIELLKKWYPIEGMKVASRLPNHSEGSIKQKASRLSLKYIGPNKNNKKVRCVETNTIFGSIVEAALFAKLKNGSSIGLCCRGIRNMAGGYHWEFIENRGNKNE